MTHAHFPHTIADFEPGDHLCCIYETEEEHRAVLAPFLRHGLERGEKVIYIVDARTAETILGYLRDDGLNVEPYLTSGQLIILTRNDAYMREGAFDPDRMISLLRAETEQTLAEGYSALRVTGEMTWALRELPGSERLIEYEAKLNKFFPGSKCLAICQYDRRRFDPEVLLDVLRTHPIAMVDAEIYDNFYYIPPAELLNNLPATELRYWVQNLAERKRTEEALQQYAERLETLREIDQAILVAQSPEEIAQAALHHIRRLVPCLRASVGVLDWEVNEATVVAALVNGETKFGTGTRLPLEAEGVAEELQQGKVHIVEDILTLSHPQPGDEALLAEGVRSYITMPFIFQGTLIGTLNLGKDSPGAFSSEYVDIALEVADILAIAIQQARMHEQSRRHAEQLEERVRQRTAELRKFVNLMAGREVRMAELKDVIRQLHAQLEEAGLTPVAKDPLAP